MEKHERKVLKSFHDSQDKLKTAGHQKGRHYQPEDVEGAEYTRYPATKRDVDEARVKFLEDEGYISTEPAEDE